MDRAAGSTGDGRDGRAGRQVRVLGLFSGIDRLRALGNAVVAEQARAAFVGLWRRAFGAQSSPDVGSIG